MCVLVTNCLWKGVSVFANLEPQWNESMGCYTLNFFDRVKLASKKNYQMIRPGDKNTIFFQFGKVLQKTQYCCPRMVHPTHTCIAQVTKGVFALDFIAPFSPLTAFLTALSSFDHGMLAAS